VPHVPNAPLPNAPLAARLVDAFRWVDVGPDSTHLVSDTSGWWRDPSVLSAIGPALAELFRGDRPTVVVSPEKVGFIVGPLVASALGVGFVEAYKSTRTRQIADRLVWRSTGPDYRGRELRLGVRVRHLAAQDRVLLVDDWADTGAQLAALRQLVLDVGASYLGAAVIVSDCPEPVCRRLRLRSLLRGTDLDARLP
jgi:adenine phosphoribosyltransferase